MDTPSPIIKDNFMAPRNVGTLTEPAFKACSGSLVCGAAVRVSLQIDDAQRIIEARFKAAGCSYLVATASYLTEHIKGELSGEVGALVQPPAETIKEALAPIPEHRTHCVNLFCNALLSAITLHSDSIRDEWQGDDTLICSCFCVSEKTILNAINGDALQTVGEVTNNCNAGGGCRSCHSLIQDILDDCNVGSELL